MLICISVKFCYPRHECQEDCHMLKMNLKKKKKEKKKKILLSLRATLFSYSIEMLVSQYDYYIGFRKGSLWCICIYIVYKYCIYIVCAYKVYVEFASRFIKMNDHKDHWLFIVKDHNQHNQIIVGAYRNLLAYSPMIPLRGIHGLMD